MKIRIDLGVPQEARILLREVNRKIFLIGIFHFLLTRVKFSKMAFITEMLKSRRLILYPYCYSFVKSYDRQKCQNGHFMLFYDIYDGHEMSQTYSNMGIKLTVSISAFQSYKPF